MGLISGENYALWLEYNPTYLSYGTKMGIAIQDGAPVR
jgi:lysylphosphatidylglycerol synthetase-like protein (DUF2156 family)